MSEPVKQQGSSSPRARGAGGAVDVEVCGQNVRLGCEPGQEDRIRRLAEAVDSRAKALSESGVSPANTPFSRLVLMAALMLADELEEAHQRDGLAQGAQGAKGGQGAKADAPEPGPIIERAPADALDHAFARILIDAAQRLESVAQKIEQD